ncbi:MAG: T9SS type A sorting domain-containing protein, partial [Salinivirgaceae bacterium]|nr:T9SS type A sorting domain-containing protein [Salinivirgaceae bacterium]
SGAIGSTNGDHYYVKVSTDGGTTWTPIWDAVDAAAADYEEVTVALSAYQGQDIKLAWQGVDGDGQGLWFTWFIDHITIGNGKNVISFNDLQFVSKASSNSSVVSERTFSRDGSVEVVSNRSAKGFVDYKIYLDDMTTPYAQNVTATSFEFTELAAGNYIAGVQRVYETGASEIVTIPFEIVEPEYDVTFTVKSSGAVVAGAKIKVGTTEKTTNASGVAVFTMVDGDYTYIVTKDGYQAANGSFIVNGANLPVAVNLLVGMDDVAANLVKLYPNPVVDILTIERGNNEQVIAEIYNSNGTLINSTNVEDAIITFDVSYMSSGSYYIRLIGTSNTTIHRFIKQ